MKEILRYFFSPFVRPKLKLYIGKVAVGTPYFLPRRLVKDPENPKKSKYVPKKIGFDYCRLGWKTKWSNTDYRYEWSPVFSFVIFGLQFAVTVTVNDANHYWSSWLYYQNDTDKTKSTKERVKQCIDEYPQIWKVSSRGDEKTVNYYDIILKKKWKQVSVEVERDNKLKKLGI